MLSGARQLLQIMSGAGKRQSENWRFLCYRGLPAPKGLNMPAQGNALVVVLKFGTDVGQLSEMGDIGRRVN
jgi:hypothetical protein